MPPHPLHCLFIDYSPLDNVRNCCYCQKLYYTMLCTPSSAACLLLFQEYKSHVPQCLTTDHEGACHIRQGGSNLKKKNGTCAKPPL